ncbi:MAG: tyrosine-type recombinase/integrase [Sulfurimonas sp.]|nr:tyrosine-type recombinase/integrase [Sulfurimonas sp.]
MSLKSSDLEFCKLQRDKIMQQLAEYSVNGINWKNPTGSNFHISFEVKPDISKGETEEGARKIAEEIGKKLLQDLNPSNLHSYLNVEKPTPTVSNNLKSELWDEVWENLDKYLSDFIKDKIKQDRISANTQKNMEASFKYLKLFCIKGAIPDLQFYKEVQNQMEMMPIDYLRGTRWQNVPMEELAKRFEQSDYETLNSKTINKHLNIHKQFFNWLTYNDGKYETNMGKLKTLHEDDEITKEEYSQNDLRTIFNSDMLDIDKKEICMVALYSGMRVGEISNLKKENFNKEKMFIEIFNGKTKNAARMIPIHKNIEDIILRRVKSGSEYLFFDGNTSANSKKLNRALNKIIPSESKTFHCFRKNFSQALENVLIAEEKYIKYLMGHSSKGDITINDYNLGKMNTTKLRNIMDELVITF